MDRREMAELLRKAAYTLSDVVEATDDGEFRSVNSSARKAVVHLLEAVDELAVAS